VSCASYEDQRLLESGVRFKVFRDHDASRVAILGFGNRACFQADSGTFYDLTLDKTSQFTDAIADF